MSLLDANHEWTEFESKLFNAFSNSKYAEGLIFSQRLKVVQLLIDQLDFMYEVFGKESS